MLNHVPASLAVVFLLASLQATDVMVLAADIHVGSAINIFSRYGYLSLSMRVIPRNDSDPSWIIREPSADIFSNISVKQSVKRSVASNQVFTGDFHMEFCDNVKQLLQAYFRDFYLERLDKPWQAFTGSWTRGILARYFGINVTYVTGDHSYVLIRVARHRTMAKIGDDQTDLTPDQITLHDVVAKQANLVDPGDTSSVIEFVKSFGSHYISSYVTGNSLYQVFVYSPPIYKKIKERLKQKGVSEISNTELTSYFSPWYAEHLGTIQSASGNDTLRVWGEEHLKVNFYFFNFLSLLKLHGNIDLLKQLNALLQEEALLKLNLKTLAPVFTNESKRNWFYEVIDNQIKLWEVNMR